MQDAVEQFANPDVGASKVANNAALGKKPKTTKTPRAEGHDRDGAERQRRRGLRRERELPARPARVPDAAAAGQRRAERADAGLLPLADLLRREAEDAKLAAQALEKLVEPADVRPLPRARRSGRSTRARCCSFVIGPDVPRHDRRTAPVAATPSGSRRSSATTRRRPRPARAATAAACRSSSMAPTVLERSSTRTPATATRPCGSTRSTATTRRSGSSSRPARNEYWGVEETDWDDAPVLARPQLPPRIGGREYDLYYSGTHLHMVVLRAGRRDLLGRQHAARLALERDDARHRAGPQAARAGQVKSARDGKDRDLRSRLGRPRHGGLLRRARARRRRPRRRRRRRSRRCAAARCRSTRTSVPELLERNRERLTFTLDANDVAGCEFLFVCVDTPPTHSGDADLSRVWTVIEELPPLEGRPILVMKSTVPVGTGEKVRHGLDAAASSTSATRRTPSSSPRAAPSTTSCIRTASSSARSSRTTPRPSPRCTSRSTPRSSAATSTRPR